MVLRLKLQNVTCPLSNLSRNFFGLAIIAQNRGQFYFLEEMQRSYETIAPLYRVTCLLQIAMNCFFQCWETSCQKKFYFIFFDNMYRYMNQNAIVGSMEAPSKAFL